MAVKFLRDKDSLTGLRDFKNSTEALPWEETAAEITDEHLAARRANYSIGSVPDGVEVSALVLGADVAQAFTNYVVRAFARSGGSWLVDYGRLASVDGVAAALRRNKRHIAVDSRSVSRQNRR
jgi:phage terminase large subunit GpA-like protein